MVQMHSPSILILEPLHLKLLEKGYEINYLSNIPKLT